ncbi:MAG: type ISP restriction/modification enzyme [Armatimonadota bacterium]
MMAHGWINDLLRSYKTTVRSEEVQIQGLSDDYIKFIRFAQYRVETTGHGVVAMITNSGYLDGPLFRDMRRELLRTFDHIAIVNLHGDARKRVAAPAGSRDENVFDIQQGVAIVICARVAECEPDCDLRYRDLWGGREDKYAHLGSRSIDRDDWASLAPKAPNFLFIPHDAGVDTEWDEAAPISHIFRGDVRAGRKLPFYGAGLATRHDTFAVAFEPEELLANVKSFLAAGATEDELRRRFHLCTTAHWSYEDARRTLTLEGARQAMTRLLYRPFDWRYTAYTPQVVAEMRPAIMGQLTRPNLALVTTRRSTGRAFTNFLVCNTLVEYKAGSHDRNTQVFPLYLYSTPDREQQTVVVSDDRRPNLSKDFVEEFAGKLGMRFVPDGRGDLQESFGPEDIFDYIYAVFHAPTYRERYAEFLKIDFPRVPLTSDPALFRDLVALGGRLVALHLMEAEELDTPLTSFPEPGDNLVEKGHPKYVPPGEVPPGEAAPAARGRVYINRTRRRADAPPAQYFDGVPPEVWEFQVGGYQVLDKWLKDRRGRKLTPEDLRHYQRIVVALTRTRELMAAIDARIEEWPIQ